VDGLAAAHGVHRHGGGAVAGEGLVGRAVDLTEGVELEKHLGYLRSGGRRW